MMEELNDKINELEDKKNFYEHLLKIPVHNYYKYVSDLNDIIISNKKIENHNDRLKTIITEIKKLNKKFTLKVLEYEAEYKRNI